jgi:D-alanine-D-alanine ligase
MRIGITYDLKGDHLPGRFPSPHFADDFEEEFDSPATIEALAGVFRRMGHEVVKLGDGRPLLERLLADPPEFVFNLAEGQGIARTREARVPAVLEMLGIPYSGSDPLTLAVTLDKDCAKRLVAASGVAVPAGCLVHSVEDSLSLPDQLPFPMIVKPNWEGSSKGIRRQSLVRSPDQLPEVIGSVLRDQLQPVLVEEFIPGEELTVGVIGNEPPRVIGVMQVVPKHSSAEFVYSLEVKRDFRRLVDYQSPPRLGESALRRVTESALRAYAALGCRDVARIDFRFRAGVPYFLEVNPLPGINPESSDLVILARLQGWSYEQLIGNILDAALQRSGPVLVPCS